MSDLEFIQWITTEMLKLRAMHEKVQGLMDDFRLACERNDGVKADAIRMEIHASNDVILDSLASFETLKRNIKNN